MKLPFVWKVEETTVVGTFHVDGSPFKHSVCDILSNSERLLVELDIDKYQKEVALGYPTEKVEDFIKNISCEERTYLAASSGLEEEVMLNMPYISFLFRLIAGDSIKPGIDKLMLNYANNNEIEIVSLETVKEQINFLKQSIQDHRKDFPEYLKKIIERGGFKNLYSNFKKAFAQSDEKSLLEYFEVNESLENSFSLRNQKMVERSLPYLCSNSCIAVGALHLIGDNNMIDLYKKKGKKIKRL